MAPSRQGNVVGQGDHPHEGTDSFKSYTDLLNESVHKTLV